MPRYIDAEKLKKHYAWWGDENKETFDAIIDQQPTVDVQGVKHGKWLRVSDCPKSWTRACSVCGERAYMIRREYPYCPNCSAKMDCSAKIEKSK